MYHACRVRECMLHFSWKARIGHLQHQGIVRMIVKWLGFMWFEYRVQGWVIVNMVIKPKVPHKIGDFWLAKQLLASQDGLCGV